MEQSLGDLTLLDVLFDISDKMEKITPEMLVSFGTSKLPEAHKNSKMIGKIHNVSCQKLFVLTNQLAFEEEMIDLRIKHEMLSVEETNELEIKSSSAHQVTNLVTWLFWTQVTKDMNTYDRGMKITKGWDLVIEKQKNRGGGLPPELIEILGLEE